MTTIRGVHSEIGFFGKLVKYERRFYRVFASDRLGSSGDEKDSSMLTFGDEEKDGGLSVAKVLPSLRLIVIGNNEVKNIGFCRIRK